MNVCIKNNDEKLFKNILSKYFPNTKNSNASKYLSQLIKLYGESLIILAIRKENVFFIRILLDYNIDLLVCNTMESNALISALGTNNIYVIKLFKNYITDAPKYQSMLPVYDNFIFLLDKNEIGQISNIYETLLGIWHSCEYLINSLFYGRK